MTGNHGSYRFRLYSVRVVRVVCQLCAEFRR